MVKRNFSAWDFIKQEPIEPWVQLGYSREYWEQWCGTTRTIGGLYNGGYVTGGTLTFSDGDYILTDTTAWTVSDTNNSVIIGGSGNVVNGDNNIILGGQNMTISADVSDTTYVQNLSVAGTTDIPPSEGQMRTQILEDGYWETQVYSNRFQEWVTISRTESMITMDDIYTPRPKRSITWTGHFFNKFKTWLKKVTTRPYRGHYEI